MRKCHEKHNAYTSDQPELHKSKMGYTYDFNSLIWQLDGSNSINFEDLCSFNIDQDVFLGFRKNLSRYAEESSASRTINCYYYFRKYLKDTLERNVNVAGLTNWFSLLGNSSEYNLGCLKGFLISWYDRGFEGINKDVFDFLDELTLKGNAKGEAVSKACPHNGPLTHNELSAVIEWASTAFSCSDISLESYSYLMTILLTGRREANVRTLRSRDIVTTQCKAGCDYIVNFPRAKQKQAGYRSQFSSLHIDEDLYLLLHNQRNDSISAIEHSIGDELSKGLRDEVPIFVEYPRIKNLKSIVDFENEIINKPDFLHMTENSSRSIFREISIKCTAKSERTGDFIHLTSRRFRYTKGTNLSRRGIRGVALAAALDHSDTQNISVYTQNTEEVAEQITELMAPVLAPLAQAFAGTLVNSERDAVRGNDPNSRIKNKDHHNIGSCGTYAFCVGGYRSCYTCINFQPWLEAPHQEVLEEVLQERQRQSDAGISEDVIRSTDRLLLAVQQVVDICAEHKATSESL